MKFRMRKRKRAATNKAPFVQRPPQVITVNAADSDTPYDDSPYDEDRNAKRSALQKLFASHLFKISRQHLDNRDIVRRRTSLADASTAGDTSVLRPEDQFLSGELINPNPKPKPSFRITCGTNHSVTASTRKGACAPDSDERRCLAQEAPLVLRCTDPPLEDTHTPRSVKPPCSFWCPLMSIFPDSYNHEMKALDRGDDGMLENTPQKYGSLFLLTNALRRKPETKRNGIPKVITVVTDSPGRHIESACCGSMAVIAHEDGRLKRSRKGRRDAVWSFDTSILRLEESLMRANLEADVEQKFEFPMHEPRPAQDRSVTATSVTSSISTHSSLKFGASIVKLPAAMALAHADPSSETDPF